MFRPILVVLQKYKHGTCNRKVLFTNKRRYIDEQSIRHFVEDI